MRACFLFVLGLLVGIQLLPAQTLYGKIILGPRKTDRPLGGVRIEIRGYTPTISEAETGNFQLTLAGITPGTRISLNIQKQGYAVVNQDALSIFMPENPREQIVIHMAPRNLRDEMAITYYSIDITRFIEKRFDSLVQLVDQTNYAEISRLWQEKELAIGNVDSMAARLARFDPSEVSDIRLKAMRLYQEGKIKQALELLDQEQLVKEIQARDESIFALELANNQARQALLDAAYMAIQNLQFEEAEDYYRAAIQTDPTNAPLLSFFADFLLDRRRAEEAIPLYQEALFYSQSTEHRADILNSLSVIFSRKGEYQYSINYAHKALKALLESNIRVYPRYDLQLIRVNENQGITYGQLNMPDSALKYFNAAEEVLENLITFNSRLFNQESPYQYKRLKILQSKATAYQSLGDLPAALEAINQAKEISLSIQWVGRGQKKTLGAMWNTLGSSLQELGRHKEAAEIFDKGEAVYRELFHESMPDTWLNMGSLLDNSASTYMELGEKEKALEKSAEAIKIYRLYGKLAFDEAAHYIATALNNRVNHLARSGRDQDSIKAHLAEALAIRLPLARATPNVHGLYLGDTYQWMGKMALMDRQWETSIDYYVKADSAIRLSFPHPRALEVIQPVQQSLFMVSHEFLKVAYKQSSSISPSETSRRYLRVLSTFQHIEKDSLEPSHQWLMAEDYYLLGWQASDKEARRQLVNLALSISIPLHKKYPEWKQLATNLETYYLAYGWESLRVRDFTQAGVAAREAWLLNPSTNADCLLILAYTYSGFFQKAESRISQIKATLNPEELKRFNSLLLADTKQLEDEGTTHPTLFNLKKLLL